jgi:hypothetical protein
MLACCNQRTGDPMEAQTSTGMGGVAVLEENRKKLPVADSETMGTMACTSSAVSVVAEGQRAQVVEDRP